jgi:CheY-like chemotaxis protein
VVVTRILVVEDDPSLRVVIRMVLERAGYEIAEAPHGAAALEQVSETAPDLVLADLKMPVMGGLELIRRLRADPGTASMPVVLLTGLAGAGEANQAANAVLGKPFEPVDLVAVVDRLVGTMRGTPRGQGWRSA